MIRPLLLVFFSVIVRCISLTGAPFTHIASFSPASTQLLEALALTNYISTANPDSTSVPRNADMYVGIGVTDPFNGRYPANSLGMFYDFPTDIHLLFATITAFSSYVNRPYEGQAVINRIQDQINTIPPVYNPPTVLIVLWDQPLRVAAQNTLISEMVELAGGRNIITSDAAYPELEPSQLMSQPPDIILIANPGIRERLMSGRIMTHFHQFRDIWFASDISADLLLIPGPRVGDGITALNALFRRYDDYLGRR